MSINRIKINQRLIQNIQGLTIDKFNNDLQSIFTKNYDFICILETWLRQIDVEMYEVLNYKLINKPRSFTHPRARRGSGGLLLYIHEQIWNSVKVCNCANTDDRIWVKLHDINTSYNNTFICFCHMPPEGSTAMCNNNIDWSSLKLEVAGFSSE